MQRKRDGRCPLSMAELWQQTVVLTLYIDWLLAVAGLGKGTTMTRNVKWAETKVDIGHLKSHKVCPGNDA